MSLALKAHVAKNKRIKSVFFNKDGEWLFHKRKGFDKELSRNEILGTDFEVDPEAVTDPKVIQTETVAGKLGKTKVKATAPKEPTK